MEFFCSIYFLASGSLHYAIQNFKQFYVLFVTLLVSCITVQDEEAANNEIGKREKEKLKEMQKVKKQKIQEILEAQNAAIDADMVGNMN